MVTVEIYYLRSLIPFQVDAEKIFNLFHKVLLIEKSSE
jgi:hypothetical protein